MTISNSEIAGRAQKMITCAIDIAIAKGIPLSNNREYRAVHRIHGLTGTSSVFWDFRRAANGAIRQVYALDLIIIGERTITVNRNIDISRRLCLPNKNLSDSLDLGFQGYSIDDCRYTCDLGRMLFSVGETLRHNKNVGRYR